MKVPPPLACAALLLAAGATRCGGPRAPQGIVLITLDTTRADHVGCYGDRQAATPVVDALAAEGVRFEQAMSPVPATTPSHASMFTGLTPAGHGVRYNGMFRLPDGSVTVARLLKEAGWSTGAVPAGFPVARMTGLDQGFDTYLDLFSEPGAEKLNIDAERKAADVTRLGIEWLEKAKGGKFFLWLHYFDPHFQYVPPFPFSAEFRGRPYDGEIAYADREAGKFLDALRRDGLWDRTVVIVAGDHGEGLFEHGEKLHSNLVYESTLHVPLIVKEAGRPVPRVVAEPVSLVDLAPTILDLAGIGSPAAMEGISLVPAVRGDGPPRRGLYFESLAGSLLYGWSPLEGVRRGKWKFIRSSAPELYDLEKDSGETVNLYGTDRSVADDLEAELVAEIERYGKDGSGEKAAAAPLSQEAIDRLGSLGYIGGVAPAPRSTRGRNPRDLVYLESQINLGRDLLTKKEFAAALDAFTGILKADPTNLYSIEQATRAAIGTRNLDLALRLSEDLLAKYPDFTAGAMLAGEVRMERGEMDLAVEAFRRGLAKHEGEAGLTHGLALSLVMAGRTAEASSVVEGALAKPRAAREADFLLLRALCRARSGDSAGAKAALEAAIARGFRDRKRLETAPILAPLRAIPGVSDAIAGIPE